MSVDEKVRDGAVDIRSRSLNALKWSAVQVWGSRTLSLLTLIVLARLLDPREFGLVAMANVYIALLTPFVDQGFGDAIVQRKDLEPDHLNSAFWASVGAGVILCITSWLIADHVAAIYREPRLGQIIRALSPLFVLSGLSSAQQGILRRRLAFKSLAVRTSAGSLAGGFSGITLAAFGFGVWSLVVQSLMMALVSTVLLWRVSDWRPRLGFTPRHFQDLFSFGSGILGVNLLNFVNRRGDDLVIGYFLGPVALGYYTVAFKMIRAMTTMLSGVSNAVAFPIFSRIQEDRQRMGRAFCRVAQYTSVVALPVFVLLAVFAFDIVTLVFGAQWAASVPVMRILAFVGIGHSILHLHSVVLLSIGRSGLRFGLALLDAIVNLIVFLVAVRWGIAAVAAAYALRLYALSPLYVHALLREVDIDLVRYLRAYGVATMASLLMAVSALGLRDILGGSGSDALFTLLCSVAVYGLTLALMGRSVVMEMWSLISGQRARRSVGVG